MHAKLTFSGGADLAKRLQDLPAALSLTVERAALRAGAEPMRAAAERIVTHGPDAPHIANEIVISVPRGELADVHDGQAVVAVGPKKGFFYGFFLEFGTVDMPAQPFMRPAFDDTAVRARSVFVIGQHLWAAIRARLPTSFAGNAHSGGGLR